MMTPMIAYTNDDVKREIVWRTKSSSQNLRNLEKIYVLFI